MRTEQEYLNLEAERDALAAQVQEMREALEEVQSLISESSGVYGLHLNGDSSPWSELEQGGRFERLCGLPEALATPDTSAAILARRDAAIWMEAADEVSRTALYLDGIALTGEQVMSIYDGFCMALRAKAYALLKGEPDSAVR